jgi:hypothetical protein
MRFLIRLHQVLFVLAILSSCYAPDVKDCTVTCEGADQCADGQTCTGGLCAAPGATCGMNMEMPDAPPGPTTVMLHVMVMGTGRVDVTGATPCLTDCMVSVQKGQVTVTARTTSSDKPFDKWTSQTCIGQGATCTFTATMPTTIQAKFH